MIWAGIVLKMCSIENPCHLNGPVGKILLFFPSWLLLDLFISIKLVYLRMFKCMWQLIVLPHLAFHVCWDALVRPACSVGGSSIRSGPARQFRLLLPCFSSEEYNNIRCFVLLIFQKMSFPPLASTHTSTHLRVYPHTCIHTVHANHRNNQRTWSAAMTYFQK